MKKIITIITLFVCATAQAQVLDTTWPTTNYPVRCMYKDRVNNLLYIGGDFSLVGYSTPFAAVLNTTSGKPDLSFPVVNDEVDGAIADGNGGQYIYGKFTIVGGMLRKYLAHIDASGAVTAWNPNPDGPVSCLATTGGLVYVGGSFNNIGGQTRNYLAAIDANGAATAWNPNPDGLVCPMAVNGNTLFVAGAFNTIGGAARNDIAEIDLATGNATSFQVSSVYGPALRAMVVGNGTLYLAGFLSGVNGQNRENIASIDIATSTLTSFNPGCNNQIHGMVLDGNTLYVCGEFSTFGGLPRGGGAAININTTTVTNWNPNIGYTYAMAKSGNAMYLFPGSKILSVDDVTGQPLGFSTNIAYHLRCMVPGNNGLFIGGDFSMTGAREVKGIAAINCATGDVLNWAPIVNGSVRAIVRSGNSVYIGGNFTKIGNDLRSGFGAADATTGLATAFAPEPDAAVRSIAVDNGIVYAGGAFNNIGGQPRDYLAALDGTTGAATSWNPAPNDVVSTVKVKSNMVFVGGNFTQVGGQARNNLASIDAAGILLPWDPNPQQGSSDMVSDIEVGDWNSWSELYVAGKFSMVGGVPATGLAAIGMSSGATIGNSLLFAPNSTIAVIERVRDRVYVAGNFEMYTSPANVKNFGSTYYGNTPTNWNPELPATGKVYAMASDTAELYVGGEFNGIGGTTTRNLAVYKQLPPSGLSVKNISTPKTSFTLSPNPTKGDFNCIFTTTKTQQIVLTVTDVTGKVLHTQNIKATAGTNTVPVSLNNMASQLLMVKLEGEGVQYETQKLLVD